MGRTKLFFILFVILLTSSALIYSNEVSHNSRFSFALQKCDFPLLKNFKINNFDDAQNSLNTDSKEISFKKMGYTGLAFFLIGTALLVAGGVCVGISYYLYLLLMNGAYAGLYSAAMAILLPLFGYLNSTAQIMVSLYIVSVVAFVIGSLLFIPGLIIMISGFSLASYYRNKVSFFMESDEKKLAVGSGIAIKIN